MEGLRTSSLDCWKKLRSFYRSTYPLPLHLGHSFDEEEAGMDPCSPDLLISVNSNDESSEGTSIPRTPSLHYKISSSLSWNTEVS